MKNEYIWVFQDALVLLERRWGEGVSVEQKNVLANTEPTLNKSSSHWEMGSKVSESLDLGKA